MTALATNTPDAWFTVDTDTGKITASGTGPDTTDEQVDSTANTSCPALSRAYHITSNPDSLAGAGASESESAVFGYENLRSSSSQASPTFASVARLTTSISNSSGSTRRTPPHTHTSWHPVALFMTGGHGMAQLAYLVDSPTKCARACGKPLRPAPNASRSWRPVGHDANDFMEDRNSPCPRCTWPLRKPITNGVLSPPTRRQSDSKRPRCRRRLIEHGFTLTRPRRTR